MTVTLDSLRQTTAEKLKVFVGCGPKHICSRLGLLAITALGIVAATGSGAVAAVLGGVGLNIGASVLYGELEKLKRQNAGEPTLDDALVIIQGMGEAKQDVMQKLADELAVMPVFLREALTQQKQELLAGAGDLLIAWSATLPFDQLLAGLDSLAAEQKSGLVATRDEHGAQQAELAALRADLTGQLAPLAQQVAELRAALERLMTTTETERRRMERERRQQEHEDAKRRLTEQALMTSGRERSARARLR